MLASSTGCSQVSWDRVLDGFSGTTCAMKLLNLNLGSGVLQLELFLFMMRVFLCQSSVDFLKRIYGVSINGILVKHHLFKIFFQSLTVSS